MPTHLDGARPRPSVRTEGEVGDGLAAVEGRRHRAIPAELDRGRAIRYPPRRRADDLCDTCKHMHKTTKTKKGRVSCSWACREEEKGRGNLIGGRESGRMCSSPINQRNLRYANKRLKRSCMRFIVMRVLRIYTLHVGQPPSTGRGKTWSLARNLLRNVVRVCFSCARLRTYEPHRFVDKWFCSERRNVKGDETTVDSRKPHRIEVGDTQLTLPRLFKLRYSHTSSSCVQDRTNAHAHTETQTQRPPPRGQAPVSSRGSA